MYTFNFYFVVCINSSFGVVVYLCRFVYVCVCVPLQVPLVFVSFKCLHLNLYTHPYTHEQHRLLTWLCKRFFVFVFRFDIFVVVWICWNTCIVGIYNGVPRFPFYIILFPKHFPFLYSVRSDFYLEAAVICSILNITNFQ